MGVDATLKDAMVGVELLIERLETCRAPASARASHLSVPRNTRKIALKACQYPIIADSAHAWSWKYCANWKRSTSGDVQRVQFQALMGFVCVHTLCCQLACLAMH